MGRSAMPKRIVAFVLSLSLCMSMFAGHDNEHQLALAEDGYDVSVYADRLKEIAKEQATIDRQLKSAEKDIENKSEEQKLIKKKIDNINSKISVLNSYLTKLEVDMASSRMSIYNQEKKINVNTKRLKERIRLMYLAGEGSYLTVLLESGSFYDILMRLELIQRVAKHDSEIIDELVSAKKSYENALSNLESQENEYRKQIDELASEKKKLNDLYNSNKKQKEEYEKRKAELEKKNKEYIEERKAFEADLSGILVSTYGDSSDETARQAAEILANEALENLRNSINDRIVNGEQIGDTECRYDFSWPAPGCYYISSGVGERWGTYHTGMDIAGSKGTPIYASESGTVLRTNSSCPHNYEKEESCGCGGGYGNYIIIDHGNEFITLYGHLTSLNVTDGDTVKKGDIIGTMGSTGYSTGDHLHLEIRYQGMYLNPASYFSIS